ncbi:MAG TPA: hypothetical protein VFH88_03040 [Candidatus Krumholzibacteria bacterium]|nr:hypothetical protein [Candidatus Krumholzibacteria bacterium]
MKQLCARLLVIAALGMLLVSAGCITDNADLVITDNICVNVQDTETTGSFTTFTVVDDFKDQLVKKLAAYNKGPKDLKSIHMVGASFKALKVTPHDWTVTADVNIARQDTPGGGYDDGPAPFVSFTDQSLMALKGQPTRANLDASGVQVVDNALAALLNGEDPRMVLVVDNSSVTPTPSGSDPMSFTLQACVRFQAVVAKTNK